MGVGSLFSVSVRQLIVIGESPSRWLCSELLPKPDGAALLKYVRNVSFVSKYTTASSLNSALRRDLQRHRGNFSSLSRPLTLGLQHLWECRLAL
jgi:hypothetical protein